MLREQGFIYIGVRPFFPITPKHAHSESMTLDKAHRIKAVEGERLELVVWEHNRADGALASYTPLCRIGATLHLLELPPIDRESLKGTMLKDCDGVALLHLEAEVTDDLKSLYDRRDLMSNHAAKEQFAIHWGMQNWNGLAIDIVHQGHRLFRCDMDVFTPGDDDEIDGIIYIAAYSMDPETFESGKPLAREAFTLPTQQDPPAAGRDDPSSAADTFVGVCLNCGSDLRLAGVLVTLVSQNGGIALVPCGGCGIASRVKILSSVECQRLGVSFEVLGPPANLS